jgi:phosphoribosyl 1,2-cyclic phosphodiesterase
MDTSQFMIKLWGVRGSLPRPEVPGSLHQRITHILEEFSTSKLTVADFLRQQPQPVISGYGGNTTCVEVKCGDDRLIIDAGSGLRELGLAGLSGPLGRGQGEVHLLFTHFHWDHLIGLPFFIPIFVPGNTIHMYAVQPELEMIVRRVFERPFFPVEFSQLGAKLVFHPLVPRRKIKIQNFEVTPYELDHPDPCWGYRIERSGKAYAHCVDTECTRQTREELGPDLPLYEKADLMFFDAQYTLTEVVDKANWGHAVAGFGIDIALREKIKKILFAHHDPFATFDKIAAAEAQARAYYESRLVQLREAGEKPQPVGFSFAVEGMEVGI